jgi:hypothetical protein
MKQNSHEDNPIGCYLASSNYYTKEIQEQDTLDAWTEVIAEEEIGDYFRTAINELILVNKISCVKFFLNDEFLEIPDYLLSSFDDYSYIAPSLIKLRGLKDKTLKRFPHWFVCGFPDIFLWTTTEMGQNAALYIINSYPEDKRYTENLMSVEILKEIVNYYKRCTFKTLECKIYNID